VMRLGFSKSSDARLLAESRRNTPRYHQCTFAIDSTLIFHHVNGPTRTRTLNDWAANRVSLSEKRPVSDYTLP
jgi:hypothetical protein